MARSQFLEEWRDALALLTDDEARDFTLAVKQQMTAIALGAAGKPDGQPDPETGKPGKTT